jgi:hypothetical protein
MKQLQYIQRSTVYLLFTLMMVACSSSKMTVDPLKWNSIQQILIQQDYRIQVREMIPMQGKSWHLSTEYFIAVRGDSVFSHLPYSGRAYTAPLSRDNVFTFKAPLLSYESNITKKESISATFRTRTFNDTFTFYVDVYPNGSASVRVSAINRQGVTYLGTLIDNKEKTEEE